MRILLYLVFILLVVLVNDDSSAAVNPALIRIRMHKELTNFPNIPGAYLKPISTNVWSLSGDGLVFNNKSLPRNNFITKKQNGRFDIISVLEFNEYLAGVVASEMPTAWPLEALRAQAVVARSYALAKIKERRNKLFHLDSDQNDQVFLMSNSQKTKSAVADTDGVVLRAQNGSILKAYFHADCGGETVLASEIWGGKDADSGTAKDPWCAIKKSNKWNFEITKSEFFEKLQITDQVMQLSHFDTKAQLISIGSQYFSVQKLREIFGFFKLRSSFDSIEISDDKVKINGQGFGHGAGLCQWGTLAQVRRGASYIKILAHYYPKAKIAKDSQRLSLNLHMNLPQNTVSN